MVFSFWRRKASRESSDEDLEPQLRKLEREAERAASGFEAQFYNRAGDLCVNGDQHDRALTYYGRAIDEFLQVSRFDAAAAVCRKLLRVSPDAVRARCTLAWLSIGKELLGDARVELRAYVRAADRAGQERLAAKHLRLMAEVAAEPELIRLIADLLRKLGDDAAADRIAESLDRAREQGETLPTRAREERWAEVLRAALMSPEQMLD